MTNAQRMRGIVGMGGIMAMSGLPRSGDDASIAELATAVQAFKTHNQTEIETLKKSVDNLHAQAAAALVGPAGGLNHDPDMPNSAHAAERKVMSSFVRNGRTLSTDSDPDGGFLTGAETSKTIAKRIYDRSPMGRLARIISLNTGSAFVEPIDVGDPYASEEGRLAKK